jgi:Lecithin retinol acyltransferase
VATFQPGDHLQVWRGYYYHHGIYISDDRVIQFGSGVTLLNKHGTSVGEVPLKDFENGGTAKVVRHGYESWFSGYHPEFDERWKVVARAEWLLKRQPRLPYNLIGHNCEHVANVCASRNWSESYQTRRWFFRKAVSDAALIFWMGGRSRANRPIPRWGRLAIVGWVVVGVAAIGTYNHQIKRFWDEILVDWQAHERMLDKDPRNGLTG